MPSSGGDRKSRLAPGTARKHTITLYMSEEEKDGLNRCSLTLPRGCESCSNHLAGGQWSHLGK